MKKYLFIGAERTGKSINMLFVAKLLSQLGKKVLVIDTTYSQGVKSYFYFNNDIESMNTLENLKPIVRENFEIIFGETYKKFNFKKLESFDFIGYDYVFIEGDININESIVDAVDKVFLFQDSDRASLIKNQIILNKLDAEVNKIIFIFNNIFDCNFDTEYLMNELLSSMKLALPDEINEPIKINFDEQDVSNIINCKNEGYINTSKLTSGYKEALHEFLDVFEKVDIKTFNRIIK